MAEGGLLDFLNTPGGMGLLSAVGAGLAGARRGGPLNAIGAGLLGGVQGYAQGQDLQRQSEFASQRGKLFDMQAAQLKQQQDAQARAEEMQRQQRDYLSGVGRVTSPRLDAQPNPASPRQMLSLGFAPEFIKTYMNADNLGKTQIKDYKEIRNPDGSVSVVGFDEFGNVRDTKQQPFKAPEVRDFGGYVGGIDPITGKVTEYGNKTMTPGERDASSRGWAGIKLQREQANRDAQAVTYQQDGEGNFVALPSKVAPGTVVRGMPVVAGPGMTPLKGGGKLGEGQKKQISGIESLSNAVDAYTSALDQWDKTKFVSPNERAKMGTLYNNMMLQAKEAYNLGVLNGPDYEILQSVVKDPTSAGSLLVSNDTLKTQATTLRNMLQGNVESIRNPGRQAQGQGSQQSTVRRYNPATGRIE